MSEVVSIANLIVPSRVVDLEFPGFDDVKVSMCHLSREELLKLRKKCVSTKFNRTSRQPEEVLDDEKFVRNYCNAVIKGWSGFKYKHLEELLLVDITGLDPEGVVPFTEENAVTLMKNSDRFEAWVNEVLGDLENFSLNK